MAEQPMTAAPVAETPSTAARTAPAYICEECGSVFNGCTGSECKSCAICTLPSGVYGCIAAGCKAPLAKIAEVGTVVQATGNVTDREGSTTIKRPSTGTVTWLSDSDDIKIDGGFKDKYFKLQSCINMKLNSPRARRAPERVGYATAERIEGRTSAAAYLDLHASGKAQIIVNSGGSGAWYDAVLTANGSWHADEEIIVLTSVIDPNKGGVSVSCAYAASGEVVLTVDLNVDERIDSLLPKLQEALDCETIHSIQCFGEAPQTEPVALSEPLMSFRTLTLKIIKAKRITVELGTGPEDCKYSKQEAYSSPATQAVLAEGSVVFTVLAEGGKERLMVSRPGIVKECREVSSVMAHGQELLRMAPNSGRLNVRFL